MTITPEHLLLSKLTRKSTCQSEVRDEVRSQGGSCTRRVAAWSALKSLLHFECCRLEMGVETYKKLGIEKRGMEPTLSQGLLKPICAAKE